MMTNRKALHKFKNTIQFLPEKPGVYQYLNNKSEIIYIGKAKNLKKRVSSYFNRNSENTKTEILVSKIFEIKHIVVETEQDALLLENSLIKKYQPRYNVLLKDGKTFPWICIKNERFPRVFSTRNYTKDGSIYFGPYTSGRLVKIILELFKQMYKLRNCRFDLSKKNIEEKKIKVCLEFHIGNCYAPCIAKQSEETYLSNIDEIKNILKGNISSVIKDLKKKMIILAGEFEFELAQDIKEKVKLLENYQSKSTVVNPNIDNVDVFSIVEKENYAYVNFLKVLNGSIIQAHTIELKKKLDETEKELLLLAITDIRNRLFSNSKEIIAPFNLDFSIENVNVVVPKIGDKKKLLDLSTRNAKYFLHEKQQQLLVSKHKSSKNRILETIKKDLHLSEIPEQIECFDNSNISGENPVAACVVFKDAKPAKSEYRHFNIKTVEGINDFASMQEIVYRRYKRLLDEKKKLPQLIVIDGGKGQLNAALNSLRKLNLQNIIPVIGIAKRLEEIFFPDDPIPLYLDKTSETLKIIQQLRNEAHRFGIEFHRQKRSNNFIQSELSNIQGIGPKTIQKLLSKFGSVERIINAEPADIKEIIGKDKFDKLEFYFKNKKIE
ncbi:MAG: excinuclease ABC subunit C [Bacteroidetes bacterium]|nr:excinuclease ABC subunit C [Bacteroidota bacterium]MBT6687490.1 excinuclease ABC subunit C [Bacteroidota bacterium]MBT7142676.1 excinuclease ABC subunit C [Bacteroidota bacterium]MBT7491081.1 excinuclease ABC subunit C [Bacteroidota bacterium]